MSLCGEEQRQVGAADRTSEGADATTTHQVRHQAICHCSWHILDAHLDKFKENMGAYSEEQGEHFHQDILDFERRYQGQYNENMMGDHIWGLLRESDLQYLANLENPLISDPFGVIFHCLYLFTM